MTCSSSDDSSCMIGPASMKEPVCRWIAVRKLEELGGDRVCVADIGARSLPVYQACEHAVNFR